MLIKFLFGKSLLNEVEIIYHLFRSTAKSKIMIDVGAHIGGSLVPFVNSGWKVYAFEPDLNNRKQLINNFGKNKNVVIEPIAVSNFSKKQVPFYSSNISTGISTLSPFHESHKEMEQKVDVTTLEEYCDTHKIDLIDFLKIDVEGFDLFVLKGFPWDKIMPLVVLAKFENKKTEPLGYNFNDIASFLTDKGYYVLVSEWEPIIEYGKTARWMRFIQYPCKLLNENAYGNLIAVRNKDIFQDLLSLSLKYLKMLSKKNILFPNNNS